MSTGANDKGVFIIQLSGKLMGGPESKDFHEKLKHEVASGNRHAIIDLGGVEWMSSSGLGLLISALTTMRNAAGSLKLARVKPDIQGLFVLTKLDKVFETYPTVNDAVAAVR